MAYRRVPRDRWGQLQNYAQRTGLLRGPRKHGGATAPKSSWKDDIDIAAGAPKAWGLRRRFPGASGLMDPSDINRTFGPSSDTDRRFMGDPRMELMRRRRRSGNRSKAMGL